ncbi:MAG: ATP-binding protein [Vicinamibacterales bacterium]
MKVSHTSAILDGLSQAALDLIPVPVFLVTVPGAMILRCNRRATALYGRTPGPQERLSDLLRDVSDDEHQIVGAITKTVASGKGIEDTEALLDGASGGIAVSVSVEPVSADDGAVIAAMVVCRPIATWKQAERNAAALRRSEQRLTLALGAGRLGAWELDFEKNALTATAQCKANHGLAPHAPLEFETDVVAAIDPDFRETFRATVADTIAANGAFEIEVPHTWPDGSHHWLLLAGRVVDSRCMVGVSRDVTERRHFEDALRDSENRFHTLADNIAQLAWMANPSGWVFWFNRRWFEYTGRSLAEMEGWGWQELHHPDHLQRVIEKLRQCFQTGDVWDDTFPLRRKDGTYRWFLSRALPIRDEQGRITRWFGTSTDVTEQRRAEEELLDADRRKDEFLAVLGHELRGPLAPILTAARLLEIKGPQDVELQRLRETIVRQTGHLTRLVDDLLDVGRITAGKLRIDKTHVELNTIVRQAAEACGPDIERRRHTLHVTYSATPIMIAVDTARLVQVLSNLLHNAAKYMREGGRIDMVAYAEGSEAVVRVTDEGVGIPHEMLSRIFQRFVQIGSSGDRSDGGLGIGLSLVRALVEMHGGSVHAHSDGIGKGSRFTVRLPSVASL